MSQNYQQTVFEPIGGAYQLNFNDAKKLDDNTIAINGFERKIGGAPGGGRFVFAIDSNYNFKWALKFESPQSRVDWFTRFTAQNENSASMICESSRTLNDSVSNTAIKVDVNGNLIWRNTIADSSYRLFGNISYNSDEKYIFSGMRCIGIFNLDGDHFTGVVGVNKSTDGNVENYVELDGGNQSILVGEQCAYDTISNLYILPFIAYLDSNKTRQKAGLMIMDTLLNVVQSFTLTNSLASNTTKVLYDQNTRETFYFVTKDYTGTGVTGISFIKFDSLFNVTYSQEYRTNNDCFVTEISFSISMDTILIASNFYNLTLSRNGAVISCSRPIDPPSNAGGGGYCWPTWSYIDGNSLYSFCNYTVNITNFLNSVIGKSELSGFGCNNEIITYSSKPLPISIQPFPITQNNINIISDSSLVTSNVLQFNKYIQCNTQVSITEIQPPNVSIVGLGNYGFVVKGDEIKFSNYDYEVYNTMGALINRGNAVVNQEVKMPNLSPGIYIILARVNGIIITLKTFIP
jgi:hypothetical protein